LRSRVDPATRTAKVRCAIDNADRALKPEMYANVTINLETHQGALTVPPSAVGGAGANPAVYVVRNSRLQKIEVTTAIRTGEYVEITSGLTGNEQIVNNFTPALIEGEQVRTAIMPNSEADYTASAKE